MKRFVWRIKWVSILRSYEAWRGGRGSNGIWVYSVSPEMNNIYYFVSVEFLLPTQIESIIISMDPAPDTLHSAHDGHADLAARLQ